MKAARLPFFKMCRDETKPAFRAPEQRKLKWIVYHVPRLRGPAGKITDSHSTRGLARKPIASSRVMQNRATACVWPET
jgi:hypothetical protein